MLRKSCNRKDSVRAITTTLPDNFKEKMERIKCLKGICFSKQIILAIRNYYPEFFLDNDSNWKVEGNATKQTN